MRKIINSAFVSVDGVTEDPSSWATFDADSGARVFGDAVDRDEEIGRAHV